MLRIYRTAYNYQITRGNWLYTCDTDLKHFKRVTQITDRFIPSGTLVRNPSKRLIFHFQNQIKSHDSILQQ